MKGNKQRKENEMRGEVEREMRVARARIKTHWRMPRDFWECCHILIRLSRPEIFSNLRQSS